MATPESTAYGLPIISVVGDGFCVPYPVELIVKRKCHGLFDARYGELDASGNLLLRVDGCFENIQKKRTMRDAAGFPILTMRAKVLTARHRWTVHRGESSETSDLLFSPQRSHSLQLKTKLDVFLAGNINEDVGNYQVVGTYSSPSYKVYKGDAVIAEADHNFAWGNICKGKHDFRIKVNPGVDYGFIVALLASLAEDDIV